MMSSPIKAPRANEADARMTGDRTEAKFLLEAARVPAFAREVAEKLQSHRFEGAGANRLPRAQHYISTVYFDTDEGHLFQAAQASGDNVKLRAREYYDLHPELTELATDPRQLVRFTPVLWLELKLKSGSRTTKRRVGIPKRDVAAFFEGGAATEEMIRIQRSAHGDEAEQILTELSAFRDRFESPLRAACLVNYRRNAWQNPHATLRVTLDRNLSCYAPLDNLWTRKYALLRDTLGEARHQQSQVVLELKWRGELPEWTSELLERHGAQPHAFSKFLTAYRAVRG